MGDSGSAHQVGTFSSCVEEIHTRGILQVIHMRDRPVTWSDSLYRIRLGSQVYGSLLEEFPKSHRNTVNDEHYFSSTDRRPVGEDHTGFGGHVVGMCHIPQGWMGRAFSLSRVRLKQQLSDEHTNGTL